MGGATSLVYLFGKQATDRHFRSETHYSEMPQAVLDAGCGARSCFQ